MKVLHLTLEKKWFDMIASGDKKEEYREIKPYWDTRLLNRNYDVVSFRNGYGKKSPIMTVQLTGIWMGYGREDLGAPILKRVYILTLGRVLELNYQG